MATGVRTTSTSTDNLKKGPGPKGRSSLPTGPILDEQGNILPYPGYNVTTDSFCPPSPIPRLAAVASFSRPVPTAGEYGIEMSKEPTIPIPPECYLYDEDRPWVLGKLNKEALDLPEPAEPLQLPKHVLDILDAMEQAIIATNTAQVANSYEDENGQPKPPLDTRAFYAKEKAARLAKLENAAAAAEATTTDANANVLLKESSVAPAEGSKPAPIKPKSRTASVSPTAGVRRSSTGHKTSVSSSASSALRVQPTGSVSPRVKSTVPPATRTSPAPISKPKLQSKSPGRGDAPPSKLASAAPAPKKVAQVGK